MSIVRPNVERIRRPLLAIAAGGMMLSALACARTEGGRAAAADSSNGPASAAPAPSPYVSDIPAWPADTGPASTDREGHLPARLAAAVPTCSAITPVVARDSIGPFYPGQPLANLFGACQHPLQLWHWSDGKFVPAVALKAGGAVLLLDANGVIPDAVVIRVVALSGARTAEGIGPGSTLADVQRAYGAPTWQRDQCSVGAAFESRPGLVVHISIPESGGDAYTCEDIRRFAAGRDFTRFPRGSTVGWIAAELDAGP